jgi:hypothetical protein
VYPLVGAAADLQQEGEAVAVVGVHLVIGIHLQRRLAPRRLGGGSGALPTEQMRRRLDLRGRQQRLQSERQRQ